MQSSRKHKRPKKEKVDALEYAQGFLLSTTASADTRNEAIEKAVAKARLNETSARSKVTSSDLSVEEQKELLATANFWANIAGHIPKTRFK